MANPFRDWVEDSKALGQAACEAYNLARAPLTPSHPRHPIAWTLAERALRGLVADLNVVGPTEWFLKTWTERRAVPLSRRGESPTSAPASR
jgi:hypothetical protein